MVQKDKDKRPFELSSLKQSFQIFQHQRAHDLASDAEDEVLGSREN